MIRVSIAATTALVTLTASAAAADISHRIEAPPAPVEAPLPSWAGFFGGIVGTVGSARARVSDDQLNQFTGDSFGHSFGGGMAGLLFGYNWQHGRVVFGIDSDISASNLKNLRYDGTSDDGIYTNISALGTVRGRLGFLATERALVYGTAGVAFGHVTQLAGDLECTPSDTSCGGNRIGFNDNNAAYNLGRWQVGWTAGAGVELKLTQNWSVRGEYLYADLGSYTALVPDDSTERAVFRNTMHLGRAALTYRFGGMTDSRLAAATDPGHWSGFHGGILGTFASTQVDVDDGNLGQFIGDSFSQKLSGGMGGLHFGYDWQRGRAVFGVDADLSAADINKLTYEGTTDDGIYTNISALGTVRGRVGFLATERTLVYGTAGVAFGHVTQLAGDVECTGTESDCPSNRIGFDGNDSAWNVGKWRMGWTAGAGVEFKLTQNWSVRGEYLYADLGSYTAVVPDDSTDSAVFRNTMHLGRAALTYRF